MKTSFKILSGASPVAIRRMWSLPMITVSARASALFVALVLAALALPASAEANLITNGSFEQNTPYAVPPASNQTYGAIAGWTYSGDSPAGAGSIWALTPPDGAYVSVIGGNASWSAGRFTSEAAYLSLTAGQEYSLSFDATGIAAYNSGWGLLPWEQFKMNLYYAVVYKGGPSLDAAMAEGPVSPVVGAWTTTNVTFTPTYSGPAAVTVYLWNNGWASNVANVYTAVDNFSVVATVPEPGTLALAGIGIAAAAWASRRRVRSHKKPGAEATG